MFAGMVVSLLCDRSLGMKRIHIAFNYADDNTHKRTVQFLQLIKRPKRLGMQPSQMIVTQRSNQATVEERSLSVFLMIDAV